jgi:hypothetical protein
MKKLLCALLLAAGIALVPVSPAHAVQRCIQPASGLLQCIDPATDVGPGHGGAVWNIQMGCQPIASFKTDKQIDTTQLSWTSTHPSGHGYSFGGAAADVNSGCYRVVNPPLRHPVRPGLQLLTASTT